MKNKKLIIILTICLSLNTVLFITGMLRNKYNISIENEYTSILNEFTLNGNDKIVLEYNNKYDEDGYKYFLRGKDYSSNIKVTDNVDYSKIGNYEILYTLNIDNHEKILKRNIDIVDNTPPVITLNKEELYCTINEECEKIFYKAEDNYDKDITDKVKIENNVKNDTLGDYEIKYTVSDSSNNKIEKIVKVHITNKFDHTYIKVSINNQKLYYYKYNKLVLETDVTTGKYNATKTGNFKIRNKVRNTYLATKRYKSFVKYWMAYDDNTYGLHDASWRREFGGNIYKTNGSHGCVNIPTDKMKELYYMVEVGTPVYITRK